MYPVTPSESNPKKMKHIAVALVIGFWVVTLALNAPGHLSTDSLMTLNEGRSLVFAGATPALMPLLMGFFDRIVPGTALYLAFTTSLFFGSVLLFVLTAPRLTIFAILILAALLLSPLSLLYQGIVWKDVLFANLSLFSFALLFVAQDSQPRPRVALYAAALVSAAAAAHARQNGFIVVICVALGVLIATNFNRRSRMRQLRLLGAAVLIAGITTVVFGGLQDLTLRLVAHGGPSNTLNWGIWVVGRYDIAGMLANHAARTDALKKHGVDVEKARADAIRHYGADRLEWLDRATEFSAEMGKVPWPTGLRSAWIRLAWDNPTAYLAHRADVMRWLVWPPDIYKCMPAWVGVEGPPELLAKLGLTPQQRPADLALYAQVQALAQTPLFRHGYYLLAASCFLVVLGAYPTVHRATIMLLLVSAIGFALSFALIGVSCDFRYMYLLPLAFWLAVVIWLADGPVRVGTREDRLRKPGRPVSEGSTI